MQYNYYCTRSYYLGHVYYFNSRDVTIYFKLYFIKNNFSLVWAHFTVAVNEQCLRWSYDDKTILQWCSTHDASVHSARLAFIRFGFIYWYTYYWLTVLNRRRYNNVTRNGNKIFHFFFMSIFCFSSAGRLNRTITCRPRYNFQVIWNQRKSLV